jgi:hypothetical protein
MQVYHPEFILNGCKGSPAQAHFTNQGKGRTVGTGGAERLRQGARGQRSKVGRGGKRQVLAGVEVSRRRGSGRVSNVNTPQAEWAKSGVSFQKRNAYQLITLALQRGSPYRSYIGRQTKWGRHILVRKRLALGRKGKGDQRT